MKIRILLDKKLLQQEPGNTGYSLEHIAHYLLSLNNKPVYTDKGVMPAHEAAKIVLSGAVREIMVPGGPAIKIMGTHAYSTTPLHLPGTREAELSYSAKEILRVKLADLLASMGIETSREYHEILRDPVAAAVKAIEAYEHEKKRKTPLQKSLKSTLLNLLDILADTIFVREGTETDSLTNQLVKYSISGEFSEVTDHVKHRLHMTRTLIRTLTGELRPVYKTYTETGRHYILVLDRSGSMSTSYKHSTKKAYASLITLLITKADPEAKFSLIAFDASAKILGVKRTADEITDTVIEITPKGGTSYHSGLAATTQILEPGDIVVVIGDFLDGSPIPRHLANEIRLKAGKTIYIPIGDSDYRYAYYLAKMTKGEIYTYRNGVFKKLRTHYNH